MLQNIVITLLDELPEARVTFSRNGDIITLVASLMWEERPLAVLHRFEVADLRASNGGDRAAGESVARALTSGLKTAKERKR
jgi:hypothetical protein